MVVHRSATATSLSTTRSSRARCSAGCRRRTGATDGPKLIVVRLQRRVYAAVASLSRVAPTTRGCDALERMAVYRPAGQIGEWMGKGLPPRKGRRVASPDGLRVIRAVLDATNRDVERAAAAKMVKKPNGKQAKPFKKELQFAIDFSKHMGREVATALSPHFPGITSGEIPSRAVRGMKRVDVRYSTPEVGLGLALSFKSVHFGEDNGGNARFVHNRKRNDEELRVEATGHHLRQPFAVMVAVLFLPFESCEDEIRNRSSFASWVEYLWPLKGRTTPEDPPDRYELAFVGLYARDGSALAFYEIGGKVPCPRRGRPPQLLSLGDLVDRIRSTYDQRNGLDFVFAEEASE